MRLVMKMKVFRTDCWNTRPYEFHGMKVPDVLLSGHHANIEAWRHERAEEITRQNRPDLWAKLQRKET